MSEEKVRVTLLSLVTQSDGTPGGGEEDDEMMGKTVRVRGEGRDVLDGLGMDNEKSHNFHRVAEKVQLFCVPGPILFLRRSSIIQSYLWHTEFMGAEE